MASSDSAAGSKAKARGPRSKARRRWRIGSIVIVVVLIGAAALLGGAFDPSYQTSDVDHNTPDAQLLARGKYLTAAADCAACHTARGGAPYAGGDALATPFGTIHGSNITPDKRYGIGKWTSADFYRALHDGLGRDHPLYPAMPYTSYRGITRADSDAIYAYLQSIKPVAQPDKGNDFAFPFNLRLLMRGWNLLFLKNTLPDVSVGASQQWTRGRYLSNALGHCTECHTPRGALGQLKLGSTLGGGELGRYQAPDITPAGLAARGWTPQDLQVFLARGYAPQGSVYGDMYEAFHHSLRHLNSTDNQAMVAYLLGDKPPAPKPVPPPAQAGGGQGQSVMAGRQHYLALCAGCHAVDGGGKPDVAVAMQGNTTLRNTDPHNLLVVMLDGLDAQSFTGYDAMQSMPGFAGKLDDAGLADLANYLRLTWGGQKADVQAADVKALRGHGAVQP
ncbi:cytochrome c [Candidimonas humi]|uniref:Cytochrome c n=1 Tax=Candidimonas humi TaxID=683355 RepID=A0ABV8NT32_9BURK|nr:cytochrome c [Candidimonas humi]MBV6305891.1 cytochrome c [Candidimonas humi]